MRIGSNTRSAVAPALRPRGLGRLATGAVRTELAPASTVQQVTEAEAVRYEPGADAHDRAALDTALRDMIDRYLAMDPRSRQVVFQTSDEQTGEVVRQVSDEALARIRAYLRESRGDQNDSQADARRVERMV
jgi:uncharacterized FlaG/YvyC family protein